MIFCKLYGHLTNDGNSSKFAEGFHFFYSKERSKSVEQGDTINRRSINSRSMRLKFLMRMKSNGPSSFDTYGNVTKFKDFDYVYGDGKILFSRGINNKYVYEYDTSGEYR